MVLELILLFTFIASIAGLSGGILLLMREDLTKKISVYLVSFSAGALLFAAFLDLMPEGLKLVTDYETPMVLVLVGIMAFFILEKLMLWIHCHGTENCEAHGESKAYMLNLGDTIHNFIDGVIVAGSFLVNVQLGIVTSIAIFFHEIPQEMGDFGTMLHLGFSRKKTILFNLISAAFSFLGAILTYFFAPAVHGMLSAIIFIAVGHLIYIAVGDLIPELHKETGMKKAVLQIIVMISGITLIWGLMTVLG